MIHCSFNSGSDETFYLV